MPFARVCEAWRTDAAFRARWVELLQALPFAAYAWENPPLTLATMDRPHECVLVESRGLVASRADVAPFAANLAGKTGAVAFRNLGGDAMLVAPCPGDARTDHAHLAAFVRTAPAIVAADFWKEVGDALHRQLSSRPLWLSTAGLGVAWLHVRLDARPKYYRHRPYANAD